MYGPYEPDNMLLGHVFAGSGNRTLSKLDGSMRLMDWALVDVIDRRHGENNVSKKSDSSVICPYCG